MVPYSIKNSQEKFTVNYLAPLREPNANTVQIIRTPNLPCNVKVSGAKNVAIDFSTSEAYSSLSSYSVNGSMTNSLSGSMVYSLTGSMTYSVIGVTGSVIASTDFSCASV